MKLNEVPEICESGKQIYVDEKGERYVLVKFNEWEGFIEEIYMAEYPQGGRE